MMNLFPQIRSFLMKKALLLLLPLALAFPSPLLAQATGGLRGQVLEPSGAVVPGAAVTLIEGPAVLNVQSGNDGVYTFKECSSGFIHPYRPGERIRGFLQNWHRGRCRAGPATECIARHCRSTAGHYSH